MTDYENVIGSAVLAGALSQGGERDGGERARRRRRARLEVVESRSTRARDYMHVISVKLRSGTRERWVEGMVVRADGPAALLSSTASRSKRRSPAR